MKLKQQLWELNKKVSEDEKNLIENKATIEGSVDNLRKLDDKIAEGEEEIKKLEEEKTQIEANLQQNE